MQQEPASARYLKRVVGNKNVNVYSTLIRDIASFSPIVMMLLGFFSELFWFCLECSGFKEFWCLGESKPVWRVLE